MGVFCSVGFAGRRDVLRFLGLVFDWLAGCGGSWVYRFSA